MTVDSAVEGTIVTIKGQADNGEPVEWLNESGLPDAQAWSGVREVANRLTQWVANQRAVGHRSSMFDRTAYAAPDNPLSQMHAARMAVENDDVVGGVADVTEALMFEQLKFESPERDDSDIFNQIAADLDLDSFMRKCHRELYTHSQVVWAEWWGRKVYTVKSFTLPDPENVAPAPPVPGEEIDAATATATAVVATDATNKARKGRKRRRQYDLVLPTHLAVLDSTKVIPVGGTPFGINRLAWSATKNEMETWQKLDSGLEFEDDPIMRTLFIGPYIPTVDERNWMARLQINPDQLLELNPDRVYRHTYSRPDYKGWADVRLKGAFQWLDIKQQLMESDRVMLVGAANYILLIKKGSDQLPGLPEEVGNLKENFKVLAKLPVIVSDHRLTIEIITPKTDNTIDEKKYDVVDRRILGKCMGALNLASSGQRNENTLTISRFIGRMLESRRHMLKRSIEERIVAAIVNDPRNVKAKFASEPNLIFVPAKISLGADATVVQAIAAARASRDLSRNSFLEFLGFDESVEAQRMEEEALFYDDIFKTQVPFSAPGVPSQVDGATGGRPPGGGAPADNAAKPEAPNSTPGA